MTAIKQTAISMPTHKDLYYNGSWQAPAGGRYLESLSPATSEIVGQFADGTAEDVDAAVRSARTAFPEWAATAPFERAKILREVAARIRDHAEELALIDAADGGNPVAEMGRDVSNAASQFEFFAGLVTEMKGASIPMGNNAINFSVRQPWGVVARIVAFNHPFMFTAAKAAAPLAAGNTVIMKPPEQAPLSALRFAEIIDGLLPNGVLNILTGGRDVGSALTTHPDIAMVTLIGSVPTGRAVMRAAAETLKPVLLELGGKNALIAFPDCDPDEVARAIVAGMNFIWCGQSCGSTSRAFVHEKLQDAVLDRVKHHIAHHKPGIPTDPSTTMGALVSEAQHRKVLDYIEIAKGEGAKLLWGGKQPDDPKLSKGYFVEPTVFHGVTQDMRIASEEVFGPILSILTWSDYDSMIEQVNRVEYGLTCSIWTNDLNAAHRTAQATQAGFVWVNEVSKHFLGTPFGGFKQSGIGREECLAELLAFTQEKNIHIKFK